VTWGEPPIEGAPPPRGRGLVFALGLGAVSWAWSEVGFWAHFRADDNPVVWILTWLLYSLAAGVVVAVLRRFPVRGAASLILVGAVYGWLVEGVIAATVYLALPLSIIWTGVAWHGLLTVCIGWYALPRVVSRGGPRAYLACALVGIAWGLWSVSWWGAPPDDGQTAATPELASYAIFVAIVSMAGACGYLLMHTQAPIQSLPRSPWPLRAAVAALAGWGILNIVIPLPWAPLVLAALLAIAITALRRLSGTASDDTAVVDDRGLAVALPLGWQPGVAASSLAPFLAVPAVAIATYAALSVVAPSETGQGPFYVGFAATVAVLSVLGTGALLWSLWQAWRHTPTHAEAEA